MNKLFSVILPPLCIVALILLSPFIDGQLRQIEKERRNFAQWEKRHGYNDRGDNPKPFDLNYVPYGTYERVFIEQHPEYRY